MRCPSLYTSSDSKALTMPSSVEGGEGYCPSISDVITSLKTAFQAKEFEEAKRLLQERERMLKLQMDLDFEKLSKELKLLSNCCLKLQKELSDEASLRVKLEDELRVFRATVSRLEVEKAEVVERAELAKETEKIAREEVMLLMAENMRLEEDNAKASADLDASKRRLSQMEKLLEQTEDGAPIYLDHVGASSIDQEVLDKREKDNLDFRGKEQDHIDGDLNSDADLAVEILISDVHCGRKSHSTQVIEISDSEDELAHLLSEQKSKRPLSGNPNDRVDDDEDRYSEGSVRISAEQNVKSLKNLTFGEQWTSSSSTVKSGHHINEYESKPALKHCEGSRQKSQNCLGVCRDSSKDYQDDGESFSGHLEKTKFDTLLLTSSGQSISDGEEKWQFKADMLNAFETNYELCMKAVCALYRRQSLRKMSYGSSLHQSGGFNELYAIRGTCLALFLMDGDPKGGLKKSVEELLSHDPEAVEDCRRIAMEHCGQLLEIYMTKSDPLVFP